VTTTLSATNMIDYP
jgi:hypothetical protein